MYSAGTYSYDTTYLLDSCFVRSGTDSFFHRSRALFHSIDEQTIVQGVTQHIEASLCYTKSGVGVFADAFFKQLFVRLSCMYVITVPSYSRRGHRSFVQRAG